MVNIILETLQDKLIKIQKKRDDLWNKLQRNHYSEIIEIRKGFKKIVDEYGIMSEQAVDYANKNAKKEKELFEESKTVNNFNIEMLDEVVNLDRQINELSNEIACLKFRKG